MKTLFLLIIHFLTITFLFAQHNGKGLTFADEDEYKDIPLATVPMMGSLPKTKDLSSWFPTPGDQGEQGSCVGWAVAYALKSYQEAVERNIRPTRRDNIYSPAFIFNQIKLSDCDGGSYLKDALNLLKKEGCASISNFNYSEHSCNRTPSSSIKRSARQYIIADWRRVDYENETEVKSQLNSGFPVVIGMDVDDDFQDLIGNDIYNYSTGRNSGGHAMVVVGYDDYKQAYKIMNSWGTDWGNGGFVWVSYDLFEQKVHEAYTAQDVVVSNPPDIDEVIIEDEIPDDDYVYIPPIIKQQAQLERPRIHHNIHVQGTMPPILGMNINVPVTIQEAKGANAQIIVRFYFPNGTPLISNMYEYTYKDVHGLAAVGTPPTRLFNNNINEEVSLFIPYYALNLQPTGGRMQYNIVAVATIYINSFEKAQSNISPIIINY